MATGKEQTGCDVAAAHSFLVRGLYLWVGCIKLLAISAQHWPPLLLMSLFLGHDSAEISECIGLEVIPAAEHVKPALWFTVLWLSLTDIAFQQK